MTYENQASLQKWCKNRTDFGDVNHGFSHLVENSNREDTKEF